MPRRPSKSNRIWGSEGGAGRDGKYYYEHDDRVPEIRKVSFKSNISRAGKARGRDWDAAVRAHLEDDDVDMTSPSTSGRITGRFNPYVGRGGRKQVGGRGSGDRRRHGSSPPIQIQVKKKFYEGQGTWFKVLIPQGGRYSKDYILKTLLNHVSPHVFIPLNYEVRGTDCSFFVDDARSAEILANADRRITTVKGFKLLIKVTATTPYIDINDALKEKIKTAMVKRYNGSMRALNLSQFHRDPDLAEHCAAALFRPAVMKIVLDIVTENIPELEALDLSDNKILSLDNLRSLPTKLPNLRILHIGNNRIRDMYQLNSLQGLRLEDLVLDKNPLCDKYQDQSVYVSEVRKRFPKVMKLDGVDLAPPIVFDVTDEFKMPVNKANFWCAEEGLVTVRQFLEQYFQIYDSDDRQPLINAYHNEAMFSITCTYPPGPNSGGSGKLVNYISDSRNLLRVKDSSRRQKLLHQGKLSVVSFLSKLPKTRHDPLSFTLELTLFTRQLIMLTVSGIFLEPSSGKNPPLRYFSRVFVIVPFGHGVCITNEELFVTNATEQQSKVAFKTPQPTVISSPTPSVTPSVTPVSSPGAIIDDNTKQQMVETLAMQSGMNLPWSKKCLEETAWDFQRAVFVFSELNKQGTIPADAFIK